MITNINEKSKNPNIVGTLGYMLTCHKAPERSLYGLDELKIRWHGFFSVVVDNFH